MEHRLCLINISETQVAILVAKDVAHFLETCKRCQWHSNMRRSDGIHPTYTLEIHYKWVIDIVAVPMGLWHVKHLIHRREDLIN